ncbi:MAG: CTP synthase [Candidatus Thermoplasmatota archaeon]|nr:CTP synthase [Candidatus Thermoplasmatota archaeon]MBU1941740.1 CTP synthase [Candidatus Thermoplasmatota archaeon]
MVNYIIVTGGVISGLGKGITTASIGKILQLHGYKVTAMKIDPYINCDAGTLRPTEHGEVWVTEDGGEIDQDLGHYERFLDINIPKHHNITTGQVYGIVIDKERKGKYLGKTVQPIPHVTDEIKERIRRPSTEGKYDFILVEIGGTVGDYENVLFLEAVRQMKREGNHLIDVHVTYVPVLETLGEAKTKPTQHSVKLLREMGIQPDFIITRSEKPLDEPRRDKIALFCNVDEEDVISDSNIDNVYAVPLMFEEQYLSKKILKKLHLRKDHNDLATWKTYIENIRSYEKKLNIGIVGKYFDIGSFKLSDSYISVIEAVKHAAWNNGFTPYIEWIDSKQYERDPNTITNLNELDGIIVPGGFGLSGIEGKISTIQHVREHNIPYLGLCLGMQLAVVEYARNICGLSDANSKEVNKETQHSVIDVIPEQATIIRESRYGATMRLGSYPAILQPGSQVQQLYGKTKVYERHRHRYEVNPEYIELLEQKGLVFSGKSPDRVLMEFMELPNHPFFIATQAHPEFKSRPMKPSPVFDGFVKAAWKKQQQDQKIMVK